MRNQKSKRRVNPEVQREELKHTDGGTVEGEEPQGEEVGVNTGEMNGSKGTIMKRNVTLN